MVQFRHFLVSSLVVADFLCFGCCSQKRYQAVGFPCNRMLKLSSSRGIRIDVPVLSVSWSFEDHSVNIKALRKGLIEHEASDTGGVPRWQSSCPGRLAEATEHSGHQIPSSLEFWPWVMTSPLDCPPEGIPVSLENFPGCSGAVQSSM